MPPLLQAGVFSSLSLCAQSLNDERTISIMASEHLLHYLIEVMHSYLTGRCATWAGDYSFIDTIE